MKRTDAIHLARAHVDTLTQWGENFTFRTYDPKRNAWIEAPPRPYWEARAARSQALIDTARTAMGADFTIYDGGNWTQYV